MLNRRHFLSQGVLSMLGAAGTALALPEDGERPSMPDGSAVRGMITRETETAIERGLAYLARDQQPDGSFGFGNYRSNVAVTSLAGMAFMAGGHFPGRGAYGRQVARALEFVLAQAYRQERFGIAHPLGFLYNPDGTHHGPMYGHGFGTLFLGELYGMVSDPTLRSRLKEVLPLAVQVILKAQNHEGGWRYFPQPPDYADISVTICQIMALHSARNAGFYVPKSQVDRCVTYVKNCYRENGTFVYQRNNPISSPLNSPPFARTAAGVCALYSAGIYQSKEITGGLKFLRDNPPGGGFSFNRFENHYFYGHYYAVQAMWTAGGEYWAKWYPAIRDDLLTRQRPEGFWMDMICPHYGTAMACIILQVPNNYLPILQK